MGRSRIVLLLFGLLLFLAMPATAALASPAHQDDEEAAPDIRDRIAAFIEQFVADDTVPADPALTDEEAPAFEIDPNIVTGAIVGLAVGMAILLIVRGYQAPGKRDPFRSRW